MDYILPAAIVFATFFGPIAAVQAQAVVDERRQKRARQQAIFRTLMTTRVANLSPEHVQALNAVPVEFYGNKGKFKELNDLWKQYVDHHYENAENDTWNVKRLDLRIEMLFVMGKILKYNFTRNQILRDIYHPNLFHTIEQQADLIRNGLADIMNGQSHISVKLV